MHIHSPTPSSESEWDSAKATITYFSNEFPRDDLQDIFRRLAQHSKDASHQLLARFIHLSTLAVQDEIRQLRPELRELIPTFDSVLTWTENTQLREGLLCGAIDGVLLIIAQIGAYIGYVENHPEKHGNSASTSLAALGVGLLSSTAVALASSASDLPLTGADAVRLAFRMGTHVQAVSESLEARDMTGKPDTWAYVVHDVQHGAAQKELDAMHARDECAETNKIFISAVSRTSITVSGPPTRLKDLFNKCKYFRNSKFIPLPVYGGLCHAPHVYGHNDTQRIIYGGRTPLSSIAKQAVVAMPVYSTSTGLPYSARRASELLECIITELLTQAIHWDNVIGGITASVHCAMSSEVILNCFNDSIPLNDLNTALNSCTAKIQTSLNNLMAWIFEMAPVDTMPSGPAQSKLAIVGMSCRLPGGATNTEKFWEILEKGLDVSRRIPADRFDIDTHYDPTGKQLNKSMTQYGCFIDEPGMFDAPFFNMSPREAQVVDPQMRLALVTAYEALEQSGYVGNRTPSTRLERIGTYYGQAADDYREVNQGQEVSTYYIPGGCRAFGPGRINYFFKFAGPSYSIDTACSSGLAAIEIACQALWKGDVDTAVAGGVNVLTNPDGFAGLCNGHFLTKGHNACKTWCETADGYCRADGVGSLVIKRLEDAEADNDNVLGVILAAGTNHSAEAVSITHPHAGHQAYLSRQILRQACVNPLDVSYVELHGTGTQAGDFEEMSGMMEVYAPLLRRRGKDQPLYIGGVKSNIGHGESAAGTAALIKVLIMLQKNAIPPHIGIKSGNINPRFPKDFNKRNLHIPFEMTPWKQAPEGKRRIAAINNFGAAGGNTMMLLEEAPARDAPEADQRNSHVVSVSAKTKASLAGNIASLLKYLEANDDTQLADLAYTTTARRYQHSFRVAVSASDISSLRKQLAAHLDKVDSLKPVGKSASPPVAFAFTGQGASNKSMNLELYRDVPTFREHLLQLDSLATAQGFPSFIPAINGSHPKDHAHSPVVTQLALTCTEIALAKYWSSLGIKPDLVIGHSLGEYAALHVAGVITANDAIFMVGRRAQMLESKCKVGSHTMMAVRASLAQIEGSAENKPYTVACINGPADTVLSGTKEEVDNVALSLEAAGYRCIKLDVAFAFHSEQTDPILDDFEMACKGCVFSEPKLPVISPLLGKVVFDGQSFSANYMRRSTREAVNFVGAMDNALQIGAISNEAVWLEMGPHPVCVGFIKSIMKPSVAVASMRREDSNWKTISDSLASLHQAGIVINWSELHRPFDSSLRLLDLPTYSWNDKNYWLQYNGDWCLTKGNTFYNDEKAAKKQEPTLPSVTSEIQTSTVQQIVDVQVNGSAGTVVMQSDLMQPDFLAAAHGHRMNDCGVVTSSIHADIAYTLGNYLYKKLFPKSKSDPALNMANLVVTKGLVANSNTNTRQLIQVTATTADINSGVINLTWQTMDNEGTINEPFASANLFVSKETSGWLASWEPIAHLIHSRIESLDRLAAEGKANRFSRNMAYTLFASNLVDYANKYRGMQSVVMHELEAYADVQLSVKESGNWTVAPYYIDSVAHLAGFIMNCSDAMDTQKNYCVTPGWKSMRFAQPLLPGEKYRSYVKMIPSKDGNGYFGDVYIMREDGVIVGMVGGIEFHSFPRILLPRFFSPPDKAAAGETKAKSATPVQAVQKAPVEAPLRTVAKAEIVTASPPSPPLTPVAEVSVNDGTVAAPVAIPAPASASDSISSKALVLIADEAGLELDDLADDVAFADLGVDSLMSLVLSEKFRSELDVKVSGSLFLDFPTVGDLRMWLEEYYS